MLPRHHRTPGFRLFSAASLWNRPVPAHAPIHPHSAELVAANLLPIKPGLQINLDAWTMPVYFVDASTPGVDVACIYAKAHGDRPTFVDRHGKSWIKHTPEGVILKDVPIPPDALPDTAVALRPEVMADAHLCIVDLERRLEWDFCWMAKREDGQWFAGQGIVFDLDGDGVPPNFVGSARGSGFPLTAGLIFRDEIEAGEIQHPLVFAFNPPGAAHVYPPASCSDGPRPVDQKLWGLPEGALLQLDPALDIDKLNLDRGGRIIARALQEYGMYCCDGAGDFVVYAEGFPFAEPDPWRDWLTPDSPIAIPVERFRVLDWGNQLFAEKDKPHNAHYYKDREFLKPELFPPLPSAEAQRVRGPLNAYRARYKLPPVPPR